ncbi:MAG: glycosyltransferase family 4 protein [Lachnospiraceae bacterium]|nr:glycosyltransferase family 4 protein [Lachnospiraceae bacterium]
MKKKRIAIVALGYAWLPGEKGPSRFYYMANIFAESGYEVELIGSDFQHFEKRPRDITDLNSKTYKFKNVFIHVPTYKKNIDIRRIWSNYKASKNVLSYLRRQEKYDAIFCVIPANNVAAKVTKFCKKNGIPIVIDIEDLWPEAMKMVLNMPIVSDILYYPMMRDAEYVYSNADAVIGTSDDYTNRAFMKREKNIPAETIYVGCDLNVFDQGVKKYLSTIEKKEDEFWVSYAGTIGTSYDIKTLIEVANEIEKKGIKEIKFKIMGTGPLLKEMKELIKQLGNSNVELMGYMEYPIMAAYLAKTDVVVNSFVKSAPQSIVNKIGDYLASGSTMINTLANLEFRRIVEENGFGINIEAENNMELMRVVLELFEDENLRKEMSIASRKCAEEKFNRLITYKRAVKVVEALINE